MSSIFVTLAVLAVAGLGVYFAIRLLAGAAVFVRNSLIEPGADLYYRLTYPERVLAANNNPQRKINTQTVEQRQWARRERRNPKVDVSPEMKAEVDRYNARMRQERQQAPPQQSGPDDNAPLIKPIERPAALTAEERERVWEELILPDTTKDELKAIQKLLLDPGLLEKDWGTKFALKGAILSGPPGTGKTTIAKALAKSAGYAFFTLDPATAQSKWVGESEKVIAALYNSARENAPAMVFLDEIDAFASKRTDTSGDAGGAGKARNSLVNQLLQEIDGFSSGDALVFTVAATNRPDTLDAALKSRLNYNIEVPLPTPEARMKILDLYLGGFFERGRLAPGMRAYLFDRTDGMSGRDIKNLAGNIPMMTFATGEKDANQEIIDRALERTMATEADAY